MNYMLVCFYRKSQRHKFCKYVLYVYLYCM